MLDEQKVFDRTPPVILPILHAMCIRTQQQSNNSLIDNKNFHGDERFALHATGYKLFLCLHCIFNMNPLSLWVSCWSIVSSSCTPPFQFPGLPSNTPPQKQPLWKYQFKYLKIQGMVTVTDTHNNSFTFIHGQIIKPTKRKIAFIPVFDQQQAGFDNSNICFLFFQGNI